MYNWSAIVYNARVESLNTYWKKATRIYVPLSSFFEKGQEFDLSDRTLFHVAALAYDKEFSIITRNASSIVKPWHGRMPVILAEPDLFVNTGRIIEIDYNKLLKIA